MHFTVIFALFDHVTTKNNHRVFVNDGPMGLYFGWLILALRQHCSPFILAEVVNPRLIVWLVQFALTTKQYHLVVMHQSSVVPQPAWIVWLFWHKRLPMEAMLLRSQVNAPEIVHDASIHLVPSIRVQPVLVNTYCMVWSRMEILPRYLDLGPASIDLGCSGLNDHLEISHGACLTKTPLCLVLFLHYSQNSNSSISNHDLNHCVRWHIVVSQYGWILHLSPVVE